MKSQTTNNLAASAALAFSAGLSLAWLGDWLLFGGPWPVRVPILAAILAVTGVSAAVLVRNRRREYRSVERHFEALARLDTDTVLADLSSDSLPSLPPESAWFGVSERLRDIITGWRHRLQELEHARTSLEVRCRRATQQAEQIRQILYGLADPILAIDDYDEVVLANRSAEQLFQLDGEKSEAKAIQQLIHCQKLVQLLSTTRQRKTAVHRTDEMEITDAEGCSHWYQATAVKLAADGDGQEKSVAEGAVAVLRDIGDQKALQKRNAEFVSSVSHEMKTPLAGIKAYVELLVDGDAEDEETREEFLSVINGQADRLQRLVDNLLNLARIEAGVIGVSKQQRSLNEVLEEAFHVVQPSAEAKNIQLISDLSPLYLGVLADRDTMLQAAINLLSNAIKYTRSGGKVTLRSRLADEQVRFEVQDTGVGLSEEDARRVFEKFYRVKKDKDMAAGTGLGLPLAKHIVEDVHGGKLTVESVPDQGSTFIVTLPAAGQMRGEPARS
jgi:two-component system, OmpR family, phosphate regulon sensor histidine kinase PhoR